MVKRTYSNPLGQKYAVKTKLFGFLLDVETGFDTRKQAVAYARKHKGKVIVRK